jgi:hypothetical protein
VRWGPQGVAGPTAVTGPNQGTQGCSHIDDRGSHPYGSSMATPLTDSVVNEVVTDLKDRLRKVQSVRFMPKLSYSVVTFSRTDNAIVSPWGQAFSLLADVAAFPRKALTRFSRAPPARPERARGEARSGRGLGLISASSRPLVGRSQHISLQYSFGYEKHTHHAAHAPFRRPIFLRGSGG